MVKSPPFRPVVSNILFKDTSASGAGDLCLPAVNTSLSGLADRTYIGFSLMENVMMAGTPVVISGFGCYIIILLLRTWNKIPKVFDNLKTNRKRIKKQLISFLQTFYF
jgi:hypothetical protein